MDHAEAYMEHNLFIHDQCILDMRERPAWYRGFEAGWREREKAARRQSKKRRRK